MIAEKVSMSHFFQTSYLKCYDFFFYTKSASCLIFDHVDTIKLAYIWPKLTKWHVWSELGPEL